MQLDGIYIHTAARINPWIEHQGDAFPARPMTGGLQINDRLANGSAVADEREIFILLIAHLEGEFAADFMNVDFESGVAVKIHFHFR